ncbi:glycosyltransferase [Aestuariibacter sp. AA17]|uniref:Glycosyltransferase n=1 Tax=Fluctibacter corallii TaxID=2984329 RepID=A0ABT3ACN5_9ALTE|nr:glycosyltransferase [Aestuariibacter sp. AA17]MCV2886036.1 glycosyltransferase [Aestuariibacter sp. AA17]
MAKDKVGDARLNSPSWHFTVLAPNQWDGPWMNRQQLFSRIAKNHTVTYSTGPLFSWDIRTDGFAKRPFTASWTHQHGVDVVTAGKCDTRIPKVGWLDKMATASFSRKLRAQANVKKRHILYLFHPMFLDYVDTVEHDILVYHAYDDFSKQGAYDERMRQKESALLARADVVFASSTAIQTRLQEMKNRDVIFVPNGVDYTQFSTPCAEPEDLADIPHPRVGYTGSINRKVDLALIAYLADALPHIHFVMIGGVGQLGGQSDAYQRLQSVTNVHFLGAKSVTDIAAYMQHMDINTMVYKADDSNWSASGYPLKLHEYLAVGKPTISAGIDAVLPFEHVVDIPLTPDAWKQAIERNLKQTDTLYELRQQVAKENTWEQRVETILATIGRCHH